MSGFELSDIEDKFRLLLKRLQFLYVEKQKLERKLQARENEIEEKQQKIERYEEKMSILKMTSSSENTESEDNELRKEVRTTINSYIKEIDNCIAMLNE